MRTIERISTGVAPIHDELELCELNAQRSLHRDWKSALAMTLRCVLSTDADASHRVQAAITALKLATNIGDLATMDVVYQQVQGLLSVPEVRVQDRLVLIMIYDTIRGNGMVSAGAVRDLLLFAERTLPLRHRITIMLNCATALRRSGSPGESEAVCEELFHIAVSLHCFDLAAEACYQLIETYVDEGQMPKAVQWVTNHRRLRRPKSELQSHRGLRSAIARVHVWRKQWDAASQLLGSRTAAALWEDNVTMVRSATLATKIRLEIGRQAQRSDVAEWVAKLAPLNEVLRTVGAQDYECYSLYLGYRYLGEREVAEQMLISYATGERRDKRPLASEIAAEINRLAR